MPTKQTPKFLSRIRTGILWRLPEKMGLGLLVTAGAAVFLLVGALFQLVSTSLPANYLLAGLITLLLLTAWLERVMAAPGQSQTILPLIRQATPAEFSYLGGWLLTGGAFGLAALFAWGIAAHANALFAQLFQWNLPGNWLAAAVWLFLTAIPARRTLHLPENLTTAVALSLLFWFVIAGRVLLQTSQSFLKIIAGYTTTQLNGVAYLILALWGVWLILEKESDSRGGGPGSRFYSLGAPLLAGTVLGVAAALLLFPLDNTFRQDLTPLVSLGLQTGPLAGLAYTLAVIWMSWYGFRHAISAGNQFMASFSQAGLFRPAPAGTFRLPRFLQWFTILFIALILALAPVLAPAGLAAASVMGVSLLVFVPEIFRSQPSLPEERPFKLPLHPLFPAAVSLASLIVLTFLPLREWAVMAAWLAAGLIYYFFGGARQRAQAHRRRDTLVGGDPETAKAKTETVYTVLAYAPDPAGAASLIRAGAAIARSRQGRLLLLAGLALAPGEEPAAKREEAERRRQTLAEIAARQDIGHVPLEILVRLAPKTATSVRDTLWEENVNLLLLPLPDEATDEEQQKEISYLLGVSNKETLLLSRSFPEAPRNILMPLLGSGHETAALRLAQAIARQNDGLVTLFYQSPGQLTAERQAEAEAFVRSTLARLPDADRVESKIVYNARLEQGILAEAAGKDLLVMGLPTEGIFRQTTLGGRPWRATQKTAVPALLVKRAEKLHQYLLNRALGLLRGWLPDLTAKDRAAVMLDMRRKATGNPDFYILLTLATAIAYFGLTQDSTAVIIGAMLIAPLMNPMMSMAFGIATANFNLMGNGVNTTLRGVIAAIGIAALLAVFLPPQPVTPQILSRTQPTYLDLLVALFSGAAGAYAMTRADAAGAIPGVAIAAALVPPLGVVGYGLGLGRLDIAGGALLLFAANLAAIVLAAALVFLVMGFQPRQDMAYKEVWRNLRRAFLAILIISVPLIFISLNSTRQYNTTLTVNSIIRQNISPEEGLVTDVVIEKQRFGGLYVRFVLYAYQTYSPADVDRLQKQLSRATGETVTLQITTINATLSVIDRGGGVPTPTPLLVDTPTPAATETAGTPR